MPANMLDNGRGFPPRDFDPYLRRLEVSFAPNAAIAPDATLNRGCVGLWSVARVSQGLFRLTLANGFRAVNHFDVTLQFNAETPLRAYPGRVVLANRTLDIFVVDAAGAVQDVAANADNRINVNIVLRCSELKA